MDIKAKEIEHKSIDELMSMIEKESDVSDKLTIIDIMPIRLPDVNDIDKLIEIADLIRQSIPCGLLIARQMQSDIYMKVTKLLPERLPHIYDDVKLESWLQLCPPDSEGEWLIVGRRMDLCCR